MKHRQKITRVVVGVPARNEAQRIARSLLALIGSAQLLDRITVQIVVACDDCTDETVEQASRIAAAFPTVSVIEGVWHSAGGARRAAIGHGLLATSDVTDLAHVWVATTDADTVVPPDWLRRHLGYANAGFDALAGVVELHVDDDLTALVAEAFDRTYLYTNSRSHPHVHGANMGVRGDAYVTVGGFAELAVAEDHALWDALCAGHHQCVSPVDVFVATSSRLRSRAPGGFADALADVVCGLDDEPELFVA